MKTKPVFKIIVLMFVAAALGCSFKENKKQNTGIPAKPFDVAWFQFIQENIINESKCTRCHNSEKALGGIDLSTYEAIMASGIVVPKNPIKSQLYDSVLSGRMPKSGARLSSSELNAIFTWIEEGAIKGKPVVEPTPTPVPEEVLPKYSSIQKLVFDKYCIDCHAEGQSDAYIELTSYERLFGNILYDKLIVPGKPDESDIYKDIATGKMPWKAKPLDDQKVKAIYDWILEGAKNDLATPTPTPAPTPEPTSTPTPTPEPTATPTPTPSPVVAQYSSVKKHIIDAKCLKCHTGMTPAKKVDLTSYDSLTKNTNTPELIITGKPEMSGFYISVKSGKMPPKFMKKELSEIELKAIFEWIEKGAPND